MIGVVLTVLYQGVEGVCRNGQGTTNEWTLIANRSIKAIVAGLWVYLNTDRSPDSHDAKRRERESSTRATPLRARQLHWRQSKWEVMSTSSFKPSETPDSQRIVHTTIMLLMRVGSSVNWCGLANRLAKFTFTFILRSMLHWKLEWRTLKLRPLPKSCSTAELSVKDLLTS